MTRRNLAHEFRANQLELLTGGQVTGGVVTGQGVRFRLVAARLPGRRELRDLWAGARVSRRADGSVEVEAPAEVCRRAPLLEMLAGQVWPRQTAVLGIDPAGQPVCLDLTRTRHLLISDPDPDARRALLTSAVLSLLMLNRQRDVQLVTVGRALTQEWRRWPHWLDLGLIDSLKFAGGTPKAERMVVPPPRLVVLLDTWELPCGDQPRLSQLLPSGQNRVSVIALAHAPWPAFPAQAQGSDHPGEFRLITTAGPVELQPAAINHTEQATILARLRAGRKSRVWTVEESRPEKPGCLRRFFRLGRNRQ